jgi:hypothetical protein
MKLIRSLGFSMLVVAGTVVAAPSEPVGTDINPALLYYQAFIIGPEPMPEADRSYLASPKGREQPLPERFGQIIAGSDNQFRLVRLAAHSTALCDWGIDLSVGPSTLMPHLGRAKALCHTAELRATWALQHGRQETARDDLIAAFVLGRNLGSDGLLISALVQDAMETLCYTTLAQSFGEFSPTTVKQMVEGFEAAPARHTMAACIPSEKRLGDWLLNKLLELRQANPGDDAKVMAAYRDSGLVTAMDTIGFSEFWPQLLAASGGTSEGVLKLLGETESLFPRLAEILALPQPEYEVRARQFSSEMQQSPNPFVKTLDLFSGWSLGARRVKFRSSEFRAEAQSAMVRAAMEYKLRGEIGIKSVRDPFGDGPFGFRRFKFKGVDRGFELKSGYAGADAPFVMIFVEKRGPAFQVTGPDAGKPSSD